MQKIDVAIFENEIVAGEKPAKVRAGDFGLGRSQGWKGTAEIVGEVDVIAQGVRAPSRRVMPSLMRP